MEITKMTATEKYLAMNNKKSNGQYFTVVNPFTEKPFLDWFNSIPVSKRSVLLEPFAGSNNIVKMIKDTVDNKAQWYCYDIQPSEVNVVPQLVVKQRDTIENFPKEISAQVAITNPPYLAKNSATRNGLPYKYPEYDDLYKKCLEVMLANCQYVAVIIPESFLTANLFHDRLTAVISLTCKMFNDTDCPVCLALFSPEETEDFDVYRQGNIKIGTFNSLSSHIVNCSYGKWKVNDKTGNIGIECCDDTRTESIRFIEGSKIDSDSIKVSSRSKTRVSGLPEGIDLNIFLARCNSILSDYRKETQDVFLTSFKGLRADHKYRRRLDFDTAKNIMSKALKEIEDEKSV